MDIDEIKTQLSQILQNLPTHYSRQCAHELKTLFEKYRQLTGSLPDNFSNIRFGASTEFGDIEFRTRLGNKGNS